MVEHKTRRNRTVAFQLWMVSVCCCTLIHHGTCLPSRRCVAISSTSICASLGYENTSFPNPSGHRTQDEANGELDDFHPLLDINCSPYLLHFLCAYYIPFCKSAMPLDIDVKPCRELCIHVQDGCLPIFTRYGAQWPAHLTCDRFPTKDDEPWCFGPDERSGSSAISPTPTALEISSTARDPSSKLATSVLNNLQTAPATTTSEDSSLATATPEASITIEANIEESSGSFTIDDIEESPSLLSIDESPSLFTIEENLRSFENPSPFTTEENPSTLSIEDDTSSFTTEESLSLFTIEENPSLYETPNPLTNEAPSQFMTSHNLFSDNSQLQTVPAATFSAQTIEIQQVISSAIQPSVTQTDQPSQQSNVLSTVQSTSNAQSSITISFTYLFDTSYTPSDDIATSFSFLHTPMLSASPHPSPISFHTAVDAANTHPSANSHTQLPSPTPHCTHLDNTSHCRQFGYSLISLPNSRGHTDQQQAEEELTRFTFFLKLQCSAQMEQFLCLYYLPPCNATTTRVPLCRDLCELVRDDCIAMLQQLDLKWPQHMNCSNLPYQHTNTCAIQDIVKSPVPTGIDLGGGSQMEKASLFVTSTLLIIILLI